MQASKQAYVRARRAQDQQPNAAMDLPGILPREQGYASPRTAISRMQGAGSWRHEPWFKEKHFRPVLWMLGKS
jgi:hypothetical protein